VEIPHDRQEEAYLARPGLEKEDTRQGTDPVNAGARVAARRQVGFGSAVEI
jgi:hypothetical protein